MDWVYARSHGGSGWIPLADSELRWSPDSTASDYLDGGDAVELRCHGPRGFAGVTVIASRTVAPGKSGWIDESALVR
ncbi:MAG: hypothetical protein QOD81_2314 [Solirubrobacteraceae bacterium]|nr:hypothetical protein [Solirubrobacteraceae bacterium]